MDFRKSPDLRDLNPEARERVDLKESEEKVGVAIAELRKLKPPKKRFLEVESAGELKLNEVDELLLDYRRLVKALGNAIAS